jgi:fibronectin-binding autotransporter adhesin
MRFFPSWNRWLGNRIRRPRSSRSASKQSGHPRFWKPLLEVLEDRTLPSTITWINATGGNWDNATNWSTGSLPGADDDVVISTAAAATITIQAGDGITVQSITAGSNDTLSITGGTPTVSVGDSVLSGTLSMTSGTLIASGSGVTLTANGSTTVAGASLFARGGATLSLPQLTTFSPNASQFQADGVGSVLDLSALATVTFATNGGWTVSATNGGTMNLSGLTDLTSGDFSLGQLISITDTGNSMLLDSNLTSLYEVRVTLDGTDPHVADAWTSFTRSSLTVNGGSYSLPGLTNVNGSDLYAHQGGHLALSGLTSFNYAFNPFTFSSTNIFEASGTGSVLDVSALTTLASPIAWDVNCTQGGPVNLTGLPSLSGSLDIDAQPTVAVTDTGHSTLLLNSGVTSVNDVAVSLDGTDTTVANTWTHVTNGALFITGGSYTLPNLTDVDGSELYVAAGSALAIPGVTSMNGGSIYDTGHSTVLDSNLTTITGVYVVLDGTDTQVAAWFRPR